MPEAAGAEVAGVDSILPLVVRDLGYTVRGAHLIQGVDLHLKNDGVTVIMGPNGAGKSVLLRLLHGLLTPSRGEIRWNGLPLTDAVRKRQALVFQRPVLLRRSVLANMEFVLGLRHEPKSDKARTLLEHVGLLDMAERPARRLSGGEQQRLAMARALALSPDVLLMDEPTASLDPASVAVIEAIVAEARESGTKVIFVTHDLGQARRLADDVVFLHRGGLTEHTPAGEFFKEAKSQEARDYLAGRLVI